MDRSLWSRLGWVFSYTRASTDVPLVFTNGGPLAVVAARVGVFLRPSIDRCCGGLHKLWTAPYGRGSGGCFLIPRASTDVPLVFTNGGPLAVVAARVGVFLYPSIDRCSAGLHKRWTAPCRRGSGGCFLTSEHRPMSHWSSQTDQSRDHRERLSASPVLGCSWRRIDYFDFSAFSIIALSAGMSFNGGALLLNVRIYA